MMYSRERVQALLFQSFKGNLTGGGVDFAINLIAPGQGLSIQICQVVVLDPDHEVVPHKLHRPLHFSFRLAMVGPVQDGLETVTSRKVLKLPVQRRVLLFQQPLDDNLLYVVIQAFLWVAAKVPECVLVAPY